MTVFTPPHQGNPFAFLKFFFDLQFCELGKVTNLGDRFELFARQERGRGTPPVSLTDQDLVLMRQHEETLGDAELLRDAYDDWAVTGDHSMPVEKIVGCFLTSFVLQKFKFYPAALQYILSGMGPGSVQYHVQQGSTPDTVLPLLEIFVGIKEGLSGATYCKVRAKFVLDELDLILEVTGSLKEIAKCLNESGGASSKRQVLGGALMELHTYLTSNMEVHKGRY